MAITDIAALSLLRTEALSTRPVACPADRAPFKRYALLDVVLSDLGVPAAKPSLSRDGFYDDWGNVLGASRGAIPTDKALLLFLEDLKVDASQFTRV